MKIRRIRGSSSLKASRNPVCGLKSPTLLACLALVSCSWLGIGKKKPDPPAPTASLVGRIASIPADRRFVLIQSYGKWNVATGTILISRGSDGNSANLLATGETLGQFAAADVQSGSFNVGDAVLLPPPISKKNPPATSESPKNSQPSKTIKAP
ncbi:MAG: hypothetical protein WCP35_07580 [Verrucomicrobiota bacterium]